MTLSCDKVTVQVSTKEDMGETIKAKTGKIPTPAATIKEKELGRHRPTREQSRAGKEITDSAAFTKHYPTPMRR